MVGSFCFVIASPPWMSDLHNDVAGLAYFIGSILFGLSAIASVVLPKTGEQLNLELATWGTPGGALCFLVGAYLLVPRRGGS